MSGVDDIVGAWVKKVEATGELKNGSYWGRRFDIDDGVEQTPERIRMTHKILKNAGYLPVEVEMMNQIAECEGQLAQTNDEVEHRALLKRIAELEQKLAIRLEHHQR